MTSSITLWNKLSNTLEAHSVVLGTGSVFPTPQLSSGHISAVAWLNHSVAVEEFPLQQISRQERVLWTMCLFGGATPLWKSRLCWGNTILPIRHGIEFLCVAEHMEPDCSLKEKSYCNQNSYCLLLLKWRKALCFWNESKFREITVYYIGVVIGFIASTVIFSVHFYFYIFASFM